jgi:DNA polymerase-4
MKERSIVHLNIVGFRAAVASAKDKSLTGLPFVIAGTIGGRSLALDCSPEAIRQGVSMGMPLSSAERRIKDLVVLSPDIAAYQMMNSELEKAAAHYAPAWENDKAGNLYLDITGMKNIFGSPIDHSSRIMREILEKAEIKPAAAVASNKLVSKVATRTIRPTGLIQIQNGTEADFLSHQDIRILPGMGQKLLRTASIVGIREIGEIAALSVSQAVALFGKQGSLLRSMAQGIDGSCVVEKSEDRRIVQQADFEQDVIDDEAVFGAVEALAEFGGFEMRRDKLGASVISLAVVYADGIRAEKQEKLKHLCVLDKDIETAARGIYRKIVIRRIRIRSIGLCLEGLTPLSYEPDLFTPETEILSRKIQEAVDDIQIRFGAGKITKGLAFAASVKGGKRLLSAGAGYAN